MKTITRIFPLASLMGTLCIIGGCVSAAAQSDPDAALARRVEAALDNAADLSATSITVQVSQGVVTLTGSVVCEACGGNRTPGGSATVQQSLGAVVRAIPGVERVQFNLQYQAAAEEPGGESR